MTALINLLFFRGVYFYNFFSSLYFSVVLLISLLNLEQCAFISCPPEKVKKRKS